MNNINIDEFKFTKKDLEDLEAYKKIEELENQIIEIKNKIIKLEKAYKWWKKYKIETLNNLDKFEEKLHKVLFLMYGKKNRNVCIGDISIREDGIYLKKHRYKINIFNDFKKLEFIKDDRIKNLINDIEKIKKLIDEFKEKKEKEVNKDVLLVEKDCIDERNYIRKIKIKKIIVAVVGSIFIIQDNEIIKKLGRDYNVIGLRKEIKSLIKEFQKENKKRIEQINKIIEKIKQDFSKEFMILNLKEV